MFKSSLTCKFSYVSEEVPWDAFTRIPEAVIRNPETEQGKSLIVWREGVQMTFDESRWRGSVSKLSIRPLCAIAQPSLFFEPRLIATVSSVPEVVSIINSTLAGVLTKISGKELQVQPVRIKLGTFLANEYERVQLSSFRVVSIDGRDYYESGSDKPLPMPSSKFLRVEDEEELESKDTLERPGIVQIGFHLSSGVYLVSRDSTVQLGNMNISTSELSEALTDITGILSSYMVMPSTELAA